MRDFSMLKQQLPTAGISHTKSTGTRRNSVLATARYMLLCGALLCGYSQESVALDVQISTLYLHMAYEELSDSGTTLDREKGFIPGLALSMQIHQTRQHLLHVPRLEYYTGEVEYVGRTQSGLAHSTHSDADLTRLSYRLYWVADAVITQLPAVYANLAYQQWERYIQPNNGVAGLRELYGWWSTEFGLLLPLLHTSIHALQLHSGISRTHHGSMLIDLESIGYGKPSVRLGNADGINAALDYSYRLDNRRSIGIVLQHRYWKFGKSNDVRVQNFIITEPRSKSNHLSLAVTYRYRF